MYVDELMRRPRQRIERIDHFDHVHEVREGGSHDDGSHPEGHKHVGNDRDQSGDGYVCVKHAGKDGNTHVHADNNYRRGHQSE